MPVSMLSEHAQAEFAKIEIGDGALVPDELLGQLKRFKPSDLPRPPTLSMPTYAQEAMPWPARKWIYNSKGKVTHGVPVKPDWKTYEECVENLRTYTYMALYNTYLPLYKENLRYKTVTPQHCHALQDVLNEKYARHLQLTVLFNKREELLIAQAHNKAVEEDEFVDDDELMDDVQAEVAEHEAPADANADYGLDDDVDNLFGVEDSEDEADPPNEPSAWQTNFAVDEVEQYDEDDFFKT